MSETTFFTEDKFEPVALAPTAKMHFVLDSADKIEDDASKLEAAFRRAVEKGMIGDGDIVLVTDSKIKASLESVFAGAVKNGHVFLLQEEPSVGVTKPLDLSPMMSVCMVLMMRGAYVSPSIQHEIEQEIKAFIRNPAPRP